jgi:hypothetical protein
MEFLSKIWNVKQKKQDPIVVKPCISVWWQFHNSDSKTLIFENISGNDLSGITLSFLFSDGNNKAMTLIDVIPQNQTYSMKLTQIEGSNREISGHEIDGIEVYEDGLMKQNFVRKQNRFIEQFIQSKDFAKKFDLTA